MATQMVKPARGWCLWRWLQLAKHMDLSLLPHSLDRMYLAWAGGAEAELLLVLIPNLGEPLLSAVLHCAAPVHLYPKYQRVLAGTAASSQLWFPVTFSEAPSTRKLEHSANS